jgi:hypothetical protein
LGRIAAVPNLTLKELRAELPARGLHVGYGTVWCFFAAEGSASKKSCTPPSKRVLTSPKRVSPGRRSNPSWDPARLVFIDETGTSTNMAGLRGRAKRGSRVDRVP